MYIYIYMRYGLYTYVYVYKGNSNLGPALGSDPESLIPEDSAVHLWPVLRTAMDTPARLGGVPLLRSGGGCPRTIVNQSGHVSWGWISPLLRPSVWSLQFCAPKVSEHGGGFESRNILRNATLPLQNRANYVPYTYQREGAGQKHLDFRTDKATAPIQWTCGGLLGQE